MIQIGGLGQGSSSSNLATAITEYNKLNASLSKIKNDFSFDLSENKKLNTYNLLASSQLKQYLKNIPIDYQQNYDMIQRKISNNVFINVNLTIFKEKLNNLAKINSLINNFTNFEEIREKFKEKILTLFENLETNVKKDYNDQVSDYTKIKPINFDLRRLESDIQIESIQSTIDQIDIKFTNLTKVLKNTENLISISSKLSQINNAIAVQLISLKNTLETYLAYVRFYLHKTDTLNQYENNMTLIYSTVEESLNNYISNQSEIIPNIYNSLSKYDSIYDEKIKLNLIKKINNIIKQSSQKLIQQYLKNSHKNDSKIFANKKYTDLSNLGGLNAALGSTRLNYSTTVDNTILKYGYNFVTDEENFKVYLNISANASADAYITYQSEYLSTNIAGTLGEGMIGLNLEMDFLNEDVKALYITEFNNTTIKKELYENTTVSAWNNCKDAVECFYECPNSFTIENGAEKILTNKDLDNYKNTSVYNFIGYSENKLCTYSRYLYEVSDEMKSYKSSLERTV